MRVWTKKVRKLMPEKGKRLVAKEKSTKPVEFTHFPFSLNVKQRKENHPVFTTFSSEINPKNRIIMEDSYYEGAGDSCHTEGSLLQKRLLEKDSSYSSIPPASRYPAETRNNEFETVNIPLRMMIPNEFVGAVIGRGGSTIRAISKGTGARLDIFRHSNRNYDMPEKPISISGAPEKVTQACKKILEIIAQEADHQREHRGDIALKMFTPNSVVGRIIGKSGAVIKQIMEETQTKIHISNQPEFVDETLGHRRSNQRLITVRGSIDGMSQAESIISKKLYEAFSEGKLRHGDLEMGGPAVAAGFQRNRMNGWPSLFGARAGGRNFDMNSTALSAGDSGHTEGALLQKLLWEKYSSFWRLPPSSRYPVETRNNEFETMDIPLRMMIPNEFVGAVIGRGGSTIRAISLGTGAKLDIFGHTNRSDDMPEKPISIQGAPTQVTQACKKILEIIAQAAHQREHRGDIALKMFAPNSVVGRIIGKSGSVINQIMEATQTKIHISNQPEFVDETLGHIGSNQRIITVRGSIDGMSQAESIISMKLYEAFSEGKLREGDLEIGGSSAGFSRNEMSV